MSRLIDADAFVRFLKDTIKKQAYENLKIDELLTVADVIEAIISELDGTSLDGFKNAPTIEPEPQWIPCSERLPEEDGEYLVLYHTRSAYKPYVYDVISFANDLYKIDEYDFYDEKGQKGWFYYDREYGYCKDDSVIAWMPLPEPYRGEGEK